MNMFLKRSAAVLAAFVRLQQQKGFLDGKLQLPAPLFFQNCKRIKLKTFIICHSAVVPELYRAKDSEVRVEECYSDTK